MVLASHQFSYCSGSECQAQYYNETISHPDWDYKIYNNNVLKTVTLDMQNGILLFTFKKTK